ncbi:hypothetical protein Hanom_Chr16g01482211 [Helianthus anomalus]
MHGPSFGSCTPLNILLFLALVITTSNASIARMNRKGDKGSPCLNPLCNLNSDVGDPFTNTEAQLDFKHAPIHFLHVIGNFIALRFANKNIQFTESYAFSKSTLNTKISVWSFSPKK